MWTHRRSGQMNQRGDKDHRDPYERDRTRVIHSPSFRRLQRKTQILGTDEGDFHRTRLTHSLEVASIGGSLVRNLAIDNDNRIAGLLPNEDLINVICLLHDIGHPPFGHGGEVALNFMMRNYGGFEGNGQTLRLLTKIEKSYGGFGLDLTRRSLLGILKYPVNYSKTVALSKPEYIASLNKTICVNDWLPPKAYFDCDQAEIDWLLSSFCDGDIGLFQALDIVPTAKHHGKAAYHSFDCSIMNIADDIAYGVHDLEDAVHLRLITREQLDTTELRCLLKATNLENKAASLIDGLFSEELWQRKQSIGELVNYFITATKVLVTCPSFVNNNLKYNVRLLEEAENLLGFFKNCIARYVIDSQEARTFEYGGQTVVLRLFEALSSNPSSLLDSKNRVIYSEASNEAEAMRVVCDYIANMTDEYAYRMHERLFGFNTRTIFERL